MVKKSLDKHYGNKISIAAPQKAWKLYKQDLPTPALVSDSLLDQQHQPKRHGLPVRLCRALPARINLLRTVTPLSSPDTRSLVHVHPSQ